MKEMHTCQQFLHKYSFKNVPLLTSSLIQTAHALRPQSKGKAEQQRTLKCVMCEVACWVFREGLN